MAKKLMKGNEAVCEGAIAAGGIYFFGYPITPQNEIPEYMSWRLPEVGGVFLQAESEVASINMLYGAASTGKRVITTSSSPGISLMQEGISYIATAELPCVIVNVQRGGPGLGNIAPAQSDYFQTTRGGGHGDYRTPALAPWSVHEMFTFTARAFDIADLYRTPTLVLSDGTLGQMMEPVDLSDVPEPVHVEKPWATTGTEGKRPRNVINSLWIVPEVMEEVNLRLQARYRQAALDLAGEWEGYFLDDAELVVVAYGVAARNAYTAVKQAREAGVKAGLFRPKFVYPYPYEALRFYLERAKAALAVEMSLGQMVEDVRLASEGRCPVFFWGRTAGIPLAPEDIQDAMKAALEGRQVV